MSRYAARTEVPSSRSRDEIERTLTRYGATAFAYGWDSAMSSATIMFEIAMERGVRRVRFNLPMPDRSSREFTHTTTGRPRAATAAQDEFDRATRQRWRALALIIKAKLEAVEAGIVTLEEEFMAALVLPSGSTVGQFMTPQIERAYNHNEMPALLPGSGE